MPPTAVQPLPSDATMLAPLPMTPIPQDQQEAAEVQELRKDVASLSQQPNAALAMLNTLSVSAAAATESAQIVAAALLQPVLGLLLWWQFDGSRLSIITPPPHGLLCVYTLARVHATMRSYMRTIT